MPKQLKTLPNDKSVEDFINSSDNAQKRDDCRELAKIMQKISGYPPRMWGDSIIGFDSYHYKYASGHEGDAAVISFSPRKGKISIYLLDGIANHTGLLKKLGKHDSGKGCLYIRSLSSIDIDVLKSILTESYRGVKKLAET